MIWLLLILTLAEAKNNRFLINPLVLVGPCGPPPPTGLPDTYYIYATFEPGLPPGEENKYNLTIKGDFRTHYQVNLNFDSAATVRLSDPKIARIDVPPFTKIFAVRFVRDSNSLMLQVKGPASGTVPYVQSVDLDGEELCKNSITGYFDHYISGVQDEAEISLTIPDESCGRRKVVQTELIVNGQPTKPGDWPWHVAMFKVEGRFIKYICGGTLLSKTLILTAAHCVTIRGEPVIQSSLSIVLGKHNLIGGDIAPQEREVFEIIVHPEYNVTTLNNDIALLKLKSEAVFDDYVQPACLWHTDNDRMLSGNVFGTVVGWGFDHLNLLSTTLQQITIPLVSELTCLKSNPIFFLKKLNSNKFCAGYTNGTSACNGDSGGGLMVFVPDTPGDTGKASGSWHVRGIVSSTISRIDAPVCDHYQYTLFTDVVKYRDWVTGYMK